MIPDHAIERIKQEIRRLSPAGRLEWIMKLMATTEHVRCPACGGSGAVERPKEPVITKEQAVLLMEAL